MMKKNSTFYAQQTAQSRIKAEMITQYFASGAKIISGAGAAKMVYVDLYAGRGRYDDGAESTPLMVLRRAIEDPVVATLAPASPPLIASLSSRMACPMLSRTISAWTTAAAIWSRARSTSVTGGSCTPRSLPRDERASGSNPAPSRGARKVRSPRCGLREGS